MDEITHLRKVIEHQKALFGMLAPHERPVIREMIAKNQFRLVFLLYEKRLERFTHTEFGVDVSRKLDAIQVLLER